MYECIEGCQAQILAALRHQLFHNVDVRVRYYATTLLADHGELDIKALDRALSDPSIVVRQTALVSHTRVDMSTSARREAIELLIKHLNNDYPVARGNIARWLHQNVRTAPPDVPSRFSWVHESWPRRKEMQQRWITWWSDHWLEVLSRSRHQHGLERTKEIQKLAEPRPINVDLRPMMNLHSRTAYVESMQNVTLPAQI